MRIYMDVVIDKNKYGYWYAWLDHSGRYMQAETLKRIKEEIKKDKEKSKRLSCHY